MESTGLTSEGDVGVPSTLNTAAGRQNSDGNCENREKSTAPVIQNSSEAEDLCCCEYINKEGVRSHLLGFCCECDALDDSFDRMIQGQRIHNSQFQEICSVISDRLRIPWIKGARRINFLGVAPFGLIPGLGFLAAIGPLSTFVAFLLIPIIIRVLSKFIGSKRTSFHYNFSLCSLLYVFTMVSYRVTNNNSWTVITHAVLLVSILIGVRLVRRKSQKDGSLVTHDLPFYYFCRKCEFYVNGRDHHCNWLDCCIGLRNRFIFILTIILAVIWGFFIIYTYYGSSYNDNADQAIYSDYSSALSFVVTVYCGLLSIFLLAILAHQLNMTMKGVSYLDWKFKKSMK